MMPKPYYEDEYITLYHGDGRELLPQMPPESVDLVCADLPYGIGFVSNHRQGEGFGAIAGDHDETTALELSRASLRVLRDHRHFYAFGRYGFLDGARNHVGEGLPLGMTVELIWDKEIPSFAGHGTPWAGVHEPIQFAVKVPSKVNRDKGNGNTPARLRKGTVLRSARKNASGAKWHPTEKPVDVLREIIESSSRFGETCLDMCSGSGSFGVACALEGRKAILMEIEERYCYAAAQRFTMLQPSLFRDEEEAFEKRVQVAKRFMMPAPIVVTASREEVADVLDRLGEGIHPDRIVLGVGVEANKPVPERRPTGLVALGDNGEVIGPVLGYPGDGTGEVTRGNPSRCVLPDIAVAGDAIDVIHKDLPEDFR